MPVLYIESRDYYEVLGVDDTATDEQIKKAYRKLSKVLHPDNKVTGDEDRFKIIAEAYDCLKDSEKRATYDGFRKEFLYCRPPVLKVSTNLVDFGNIEDRTVPVERVVALYNYGGEAAACQIIPEFGEFWTVVGAAAEDDPEAWGEFVFQIQLNPDAPAEILEQTVEIVMDNEHGSSIQIITITAELELTAEERLHAEAARIAAMCLDVTLNMVDATGYVPAECTLVAHVDTDAPDDMLAVYFYDGSRLLGISRTPGDYRLHVNNITEGDHAYAVQAVLIGPHPKHAASNHVMHSVKKPLAPLWLQQPFWTVMLLGLFACLEVLLINSFTNYGAFKYVIMMVSLPVFIAMNELIGRVLRNEKYREVQYTKLFAVLYAALGAAEYVLFVCIVFVLGNLLSETVEAENASNNASLIHGVGLLLFACVGFVLYFGSPFFMFWAARLTYKMFDRD